jgi:hypothetical protein
MGRVGETLADNRPEELQIPSSKHPPSLKALARQARETSNFKMIA